MQFLCEQSAAGTKLLLRTELRWVEVHRGVIEMIARFFLVLIVLVFSFNRAALAQTITPEPIAVPPSEFPLPSAELDKQVAANDTAALPHHPSILWSGVPAHPTQSFHAQKLPLCETPPPHQQHFPPP